MVHLDHAQDKAHGVFIAPTARDLDRLRLYGDGRDSAVLAQRVGWYAPRDWRERGALWAVDILAAFSSLDSAPYRLHVLTDGPTDLPDVTAAHCRSGLYGLADVALVYGVALVSRPCVGRGIADEQHVIDMRTAAARRLRRARLSR